MKSACPRCGALLTVPDDLKGKLVRCPQCREKVRLDQPQPPTNRPLRSLDRVDSGGQPGRKLKGTDSPGDEFGGPAPLLPSHRKRKKTAPSEGVAAGETPKRRKRSRPASTGRMLAGLVDPSFWRSALRHLPYLTGSLFCAGALLGFLTALGQRGAAIGLLLQVVGYPTAMCLFMLMSYPTACFWKVVVGSADSDGDIEEWPAGGSFGEWIFDMLLVGYMVIIAVVLSVGVAKVRQLALPAQGSPGAYWEFSGSEQEWSSIFLPKIGGMQVDQGEPNLPEDKSPGPVRRRGAAWPTTFAAFLLIFPLVLASCIDANTPIFVPWSPRVLFSLLKNFPAWCVALAVSGGVLCPAAAVLIWGAKTAPFTTFTLCSPLAAVAIVIYARAIGLLSWRIART